MHETTPYPTKRNDTPAKQEEGSGFTVVAILNVQRELAFGIITESGEEDDAENVCTALREGATRLQEASGRGWGEI